MKIKKQDLNIVLGLKDIDNLRSQYVIEWLNPSHYRVNGSIDIFIKSKKFHNIKTGYRGTYSDLPSFLAYQFPQGIHPEDMRRPVAHRDRHRR